MNTLLLDTIYEAIIDRQNDLGIVDHRINIYKDIGYISITFSVYKWVRIFINGSRIAIHTSSRVHHININHPNLLDKITKIITARS